MIKGTVFITIATNMKKILLTFTAITIVITTIHSGAVTVKKPGSNVDWFKGVISSYRISAIRVNTHGKPVGYSNGKVISINKGRINAYTSARGNAIDNIIRVLKAIRVDSNKNMLDLIEEDQYTQKMLSDNVYKKIKTTEFPVDFYRSGCHAELKIGDIISALPYRYPSHNFPARFYNPISTRYSSLIVDARNLNVEPMILPSIYNEEGLEIYSRYFIDIRFASRDGMVSYVNSENDAMKHKKAGEHPYFAVAVKDLNGCPVLSNRDIRKIFSSTETLEQLKKCRVIIIINRRK